MSRLAFEGKRNADLRQFALNLVKDLPQKSFDREIARLLRWVQTEIRYVKDVHGVETLHTVDRILKNRQGDCDDKSILLAAMLESIGHKSRFAAISLNNPGVFTHVMVETFFKGAWLPLETTTNAPAGWRPSHIVNKMVQNICR